MTRSPFEERKSHTTEINMHLFWAVVSIGYGWFLWPSDPKWYGFYIIGGLSFLGGGCCIIKAIKLMIKDHRQEKRVTAFGDKIKPQKDAQLASDQTLKNEGMVDE